MKKLVLIYEGDTELEFYSKAIRKLIYPNTGKIKLGKKNLKSSSGINRKVKEILGDLITKNLKNNAEADSLYIMIVHDRDGGFSKESSLNITKIRTDFLDEKAYKTFMIDEIVATKELESWYLYDMDGIYDYLNVPKKKRKMNIFNNPHQYKSSDLISFCRKHKKEYSKGKKSQELINCLNIDYIYENCVEFKTGINNIIQGMK